MPWRKTDFSHPDAALAEADGLRWLAEAPDGARVVEVLGIAPGVLDLECVRPTRATPTAARAFGAALARTHAAGADSFGRVPGSTRGFMAQEPLPEAPQEPRTSWGAFYATGRVLPFLRTAVGLGLIDAEGERVIEAVAERLLAGELDHPQPALVRERADGAVPVARLHGDLWNGNVLWDADADGEAVLIDATAHGGHAETDLAMLALFGQPHLDEVLTGYQEVSPLARGWQHRVDLHQLNPLLVHTVLFGGSYADAAVRAALPYSEH